MPARRQAAVRPAVTRVRKTVQLPSSSHERDFFTGLLASHTCTAWFWDEYGRLLLPGYIQARLGLL